MSPSPDKFSEPPVGTHDLAERYSLEPITIREWFRRGLIQGALVNRRWLTSWDAVFAFEGRLSAPIGTAREEAKKPFFTTEWIAHRYKKSPRTVRGWFTERRLRGLKIVGTWYADVIALRDFDPDFRR